MKKIIIFAFLFAVIGDLKSQNISTVPSIQTMVNDSLQPNRQLKVSIFNRLLSGIVKFLPDVIGDTSSVSTKHHGMFRFQRADSAVYVYDTIGFKRWRKAGGSPNSNIGSGYRLAVPGTNNVKTLFDGYGILWDTTSNANGLTAKLDTPTIDSRYWKPNGNTGTSASTNFIGTIDNNRLAFRVNNRYAGYINTGTDGIVTGGGFASFGQYAGNHIIPLINAGTRPDGRLNSLFGHGAGYYIGATYDGVGTPSGENVIAGNWAGFFLQNVGRNGFGRNVFVGQSAGFRGIGAGESTGVGAFALEVLNKGVVNTGTGRDALRSTIDGDENSGHGGLTLLYSSTGVRSATVTNGGSGYTTATVTFSAPYPGGPGLCNSTATGTAVISGGSIIAIKITNPGCGYSEYGGTFYTGFFHPPVTITITGDGTGATATANLLSASYNTANGVAGGLGNRLGRYQSYYGYHSGQQTRYWDLYNSFFGAYSDVDNSIAPDTVIEKSTAVGYNSKIARSKTLILGATGSDQPSVGIGTTLPDASALLDVTSTSAGVVLPRMNTTQMNAISSPVAGLMVYNSDSTSYCYYNGSAWLKMGSGGGSATPAGSTKQFQYNNAGAFAGSGMLTQETDQILITGNSAASTPPLEVNAHEDLTAEILNVKQSGTKKFSFHSNGAIELTDVAAPGTPASGYGRLYVKTDSLRFKNDAGTEFTLGAGGGSTGIDSATVRNLRWKYRNTFELMDEFLGNGVAPGWSSQSSGAGSSAGTSDFLWADLDTTWQGATYASTGTTTTGRGLGMYGNTTSSNTGSFRGYNTSFAVYETRVRFDTLSNTTNEYSALFGWMDWFGSSFYQKGMKFVYDRATYGDYWVLRSDDGGTSAVVTTTAVVAKTDYVLRIEVYNWQMGSSGGSIKAYINDVEIVASSGTYPIVSNIAKTDTFYPCYWIQKSAGTVARKVFLDWVYQYAEFIKRL